jgi:hypothetical protein
MLYILLKLVSLVSGRPSKIRRTAKRHINPHRVAKEMWTLFQQFLECFREFCSLPIVIIFKKKKRAFSCTLWCPKHWNKSVATFMSIEMYSYKVPLCFNWAPRHEGVLGECRYSSTHFLTPAVDGGQWSVSCRGRFIPTERAPGTYWIGGWMGPSAIVVAVVKRKIPSPRRESNRRTPIVQPVAQSYTDWAVTALMYSYPLVSWCFHK